MVDSGSFFFKENCRVVQSEVLVSPRLVYLVVLHVSRRRQVPVQLCPMHCFETSLCHLQLYSAVYRKLWFMNEVILSINRQYFEGSCSGCCYLPLFAWLTFACFFALCLGA
jgi:hypothetical protein